MSGPFDRFLSAEDWTPLLGNWIHPLRVFRGERPSDPNTYLAIVEVVDVLGVEVAITLGGGMFVRNRGQYESIEQRYDLVGIFNLLLCEFAFAGLEPEPVTLSDLQDGRLIGRHAGIFGGWGNYAHKTFGPVALLSVDRAAAVGPHGIWPPNYYWLPADPGVPARVKALTHALALRKVSESVPILVVAAISHLDRRNNAEAIISCWIVCEQILTFVWDSYRDALPALQLDRLTARTVLDADKSREDRLNDHRTYSASVQAEVLLTAGILPPAAYALLQAARKIRNDLAHRAKIVPESTRTVFEAMRAMMALIGVSDLSWKFSSSGGGARPREALEPEFPFR